MRKASEAHVFRFGVSVFTNSVSATADQLRKFGGGAPDVQLPAFPPTPELIDLSDMPQPPNTPSSVKKTMRHSPQHEYLDMKKRAKGSPLSGSGAGNVCGGGWESNMFKKAMNAKGAVDYVLKASKGGAGVPACLANAIKNP